MIAYNNFTSQICIFVAVLVGSQALGITSVKI